MARNRGETRKRNLRHSGDNNAKTKFPWNRAEKGTHSPWPYSLGKVDLWVKLVGLVLLVACVSVIGYIRYQVYLQDRVKTPLDAPKMLAVNSSMVSLSPDRFWGTYRSQMYFGMKTRTPRSPLFGLMWLTQFTREMPAPVRHWCDEGDHLPKYGWLQHNGVNFGIQEIQDQYFTMTTEFVKRPGGEHGGDWTSRISIKSKIDKPVVVSLLFYVALDRQGMLRPLIKKGRLSGVTGSSEELGDFHLQFGRSQADTVKYDYFIAYAGELDKLKDYVVGGFKIEAWDKARTLPYFALGGRMVSKDAPEGPNFMVHQVTATVPFDLEVLFESDSFESRPNTLSGQVFTEELAQHVANFNRRFTESFDLENKGFQEKEIKFAQAVLSNMLGSIGYFHGSSIVKSKYNQEAVAYWEAPLYTGVPSRSFFPRGFLWDEGFHNLLISQWDMGISKDIIAHWLDLINAEGWIPREQILGIEARAKVPREFVVQRNENANPPTFFLPLQRIVHELSKLNNPSAKAFLQHLFPRLKVWYSWYNTTQLGPKPGTYRWRGRDSKIMTQLNPQTLTSGLDDYPRASHPSNHEFHVDLRCWMALASGVMAELAKTLKENWRDYQTTYEFLKDNRLLDELHWSEKEETYADYGLHTQDVKLYKPKPGEKPAPEGFDKIRIVTREPQYQFVNSFGYVSLFPFLLKLVDPASPKLFKILSDLKNPSLLWTDYGLRSLAKNAPLYNRRNTEHDPPYWRGAIWININYLSLSALYHYANTMGPYQNTAQEIYTDLRRNLINNLVLQYEKTGYIWEQYNDKTGEGKRSHPFTGWSALIVLIMSEKY